MTTAPVTTALSRHLGWMTGGHRYFLAWLDGLDIPFVHETDSGFFEFGSDSLSNLSTPKRSQSERLWAYPGLQPVGLLGPDRPSSPIAAYRWEYTDRALTEQLAVEDEGRDATLSPGHAAVRFSNPATGGDVMPTLRAEFHRLRPGASSVRRREVGSSVWQVFSGGGAFIADDVEYQVFPGDLFAIPSWVELELAADNGLDLFRFSDAPIFEALHQYRTVVNPR